MGRTVIPLSDSRIKNSKIKEKDYTIADGNGLQLLIKATGVKLWEFYYKSPRTQKRRKTSFNKYPLVSLKNARLKKNEYTELIAQGIDPIDYFKKLKEENAIKENRYTFQKVLDDYYQNKKDNKEIQQITITKDKPRVETHFLSKLSKGKDTYINDITFEHTKKALLSLQNNNKLSTLKKVRSIIISVFKYAYAQNIIEDVTIYGKLELYNFKKENNVKNNPTLTTKADIKEMYNKFLLYKNNVLTRFLLLFTIHTAQRQGSLITAKWCDIDFDSKLWIIPKENMKGKLLKKKEHYLPLSDITVQFLKELFSITGDNAYLFPNNQIKKTRNKFPHISCNTVTKALRIMGYTNEQQTAHGFRSMMKTVCKENQEKHNLKNEFVERILAHKVDGEVEGVYNRAKNIDDMRIIVNWWSEYLNGLNDK